MIRRRIREEGFTRRIIPPVPVTNDDLDRVLTHDRPVIIEDMEPLSKGAKTIPFGDSADSEQYYGNKFACVFNPITTPEWTKDINELRTYRMDLRQVITDNSLFPTNSTHTCSSILNLELITQISLWKHSEIEFRDVVRTWGHNLTWY